MYDVFVRLLNMSLSASIIVLVIVILRLLLKKAPRKIICFLWAFVALRLLLPFSIQSDLSAFNMIKSSVGEQGQIEYFQYNGKTEKPKVQFTTPALVNDDMSPDSMTIGEHTSDLYLPPVVVIWLVGMGAMLIYALISFIKLKKSVRASIPVKDNILACDEVKSPFILGIIKPMIYVPSSMAGETLSYVITHETAHIKRCDHWWKPLGYLLLTVYWFNPLCWLAYILLCRDIELACDEKVIRDYDKLGKAAYSQALLDCSFPRKTIAACPVAFGEIGVKARVKSVLNYKKPAFWIIAAAVVVCIVVAVCFLTNPKNREPDLSFLNYENACSLVADVTDVDTIFYPPTEKNENGKISIGYVNGNELAKYLDLAAWKRRNAPSKYLSSPGSIEFCIRDDHRITVYQKPRLAMVTYGDEVRYYKIHGRDYDNAVKLLYYESKDFDARAVNFPYTVTKIVYANPLQSYLMVAQENTPQYRFSTKMHLFSVSEYHEMSAWTDLGELTEIALTNENFDRLFTDVGFARGKSASKIRQDTVKAWTVIYNEDMLCYVLQQKNGELYFVECYCDHFEKDDPYSNDTYVRWLFKIEPDRNNPFDVDEVLIDTGNETVEWSYTYNVAYANWTENAVFFLGALNSNRTTESACQHLPVYKFDTKAELDAFKEDFGDVFTMDQGYNEVPSFEYITASYDDSFFGKYSLVLTYVPASSGSYRFGVRDVYCNDQSFCVYIEQLNDPETYTADMAGWFAVVEVEKATLQNYTSFDAILN